MGQKINPTGFRLAVTRNWNSRWFATGREFSRMLGEDLQVREYLRRKLRNASVGRILIERPAKNARITIFSARPGVVIGKKGEDIETLKTDLQKMMGVPVHVNIDEIRKPELDAQLIADSITQQLEKRIMFRRAMKRAMQNAMRLGAQGIKIMSSGRLNGIEIARTEWYREGRVPLHTLRADIDYGLSEAKTTYGVIGVKVWVYKGDTLGRNEGPGVEAAAPAAEREERRPPRRAPGDRPAPSGRPSGARRPPRRPETPAEGSAAPAAAAPAAAGAAPSPAPAKDDDAKPAVKRVRKVATKGAERPAGAKPAADKAADKPADKPAETPGDKKDE
jgi:small subunit ribosomal protein S3